MGKFKKGVVLGGLLGAGLMWLNTTKQGKDVRDKMLDAAATLYVEVRDTILSSDNYKKITKAKYVSMVQDAVDGFVAEHPWAEQARDTIVKLVSDQWKNIQKEIKKRSS